jgi:hypothetical protein
MKKTKAVFLATTILILSVLAYSADRAVLVHNTNQDIEAVKGKLKLKLVRVWGGDEEEDEKKFFKSPLDIVINKEGLVYICDRYNHCIKVFERTGNYLRTIGRRGRGPGDLYMPMALALSPNGDLWVSEFGGHRLQRFDPEGKSLNIINEDGLIPWFGLTTKDQLAVYEHSRTFDSKKLVSIRDSKGKILEEIGTYHDKSKDPVLSEKLHCAMDNDDNIYAANRHSPVIRKYAPDGTMKWAITFEPPFEIPVKITLNDKGDEIVKEGGWNRAERKVTRSGGSVIVQSKTTAKTMKQVLCSHIDIDNSKRIYLVTSRKLWTLDDIKKSPQIMVSPQFSKVLNLEEVKDKKDTHFRVLVFNSNGKVIAETPLTTYCDGMYINGDRLFIMDAFVNQRILEYQMTFDEV